MVSQKISLRTKASYGVGALGKDFAVSIMYVFLMFYYTDVAGISAAFAGTLLLVARILDAVTDPMMGMIVDNTRTRFGKFRPWIVIGTVVNTGFLVAVFSAHHFSGTALYVYATITYILWGISYTVMDIPFWSMIPAISSDRKEREHLVVWPRLFASFAWMLMGTYGLLLVTELGGDDKGHGFFLFTLVILVTFFFSSALTVMNVKEQVQVKTTADKFSFKDVWQIIASNDQLKALFGAVLSFNFAAQLVGGLAIYYFTYAVGNSELFPVFMLASGIAEMSGIFLCPWLCRLLPRKQMWVIACGFPVICCVVLLVAAITVPESVVLVALAGAALKFGLGLANVLSTVMLADVVDYGEYQSGRRSESIIFSAQTVLVKAAGAFAGFATGVGLTMVGYVPNQAQNSSTILGLQLLMIATPIVLMLISAFVYKTYYRLHEGFAIEDAAQPT